MKKVLYVIGSLGIGGAETQMAMLVSELIDRGWGCEVFVLEADGPLRRMLEARGAVIHDGGYNSAAALPRKLLLLLRALLRLLVLVRRTKPIVLHAYLPLTNFMGAVAGSVAGAPKVITSRRALGTHQERRRYWKFFDLATNYFSDHVTVNSRAVWEDTVKRDAIDPVKLVHISNGLDASRYDMAAQSRESMRRALGLLDGQLGIVAVGNLLSYKGHHDLINALPTILNHKTNVLLFIVGEDRGIGSSLQNLTEELGISAHIQFLGHRSDVAQILAAMDIFVLPSHEEGFSNALLEAMASSLAIVATDVGGNREALDDGRLGVLVPSHDSDALAVAISNLLSDAAERQRFGRLANARVRTSYSVNEMVNAHIALYEA
jgi:glycosyltransferase involved in cell wall biosynthesis